MLRIIDKQTKLFLRDDLDFNHENEIGLDAPSPFEMFPNKVFNHPKWNGEAWEEGATQEYIESLKAQAEPQEPSESERLEALEMLMVDILGGGF